MFTASLTSPYCGINSGFEAVSWLPEPQAAQSLALIPLNASNTIGGASDGLCGLLVLASPDPQRFQIGMGVAFLTQVGQLARAALSRLQPVAAR